MIVVSIPAEIVAAAALIQFWLTISNAIVSKTAYAKFLKLFRSRLLAVDHNIRCFDGH